jgi:hypothetical protein
MRWRTWLLVAIVLPALTLPAALATDEQGKKDGKGFKISWKKIIIDKKFRSEGVAVADVNKDGKLDILIGDVWFEAPDWKMHVIRKDREFDPAVYSESFCCWTEDLNGDGWDDLIVVPFPGQAIHWYENPRGQSGPWKEHLIWHSCCNETPQYVDLSPAAKEVNAKVEGMNAQVKISVQPNPRKGKRVLVMGAQPKGKDREGQMAWFAPGKDPYAPWEMHPISEPSTPEREGTATAEVNGEKVTVKFKIPGNEIPGTFRFYHGLGIGDMNGDGRPDVICPHGWWEQPLHDDGRPWKFHPANLGPPCADMFAYDVDGDGKMDVISSSAHNFGIWWHQQRVGKDGKPAFVQQELFKDLIAQTHALHCVDIDNDGLKDLVTGCRWWAHGPKGDTGAKQKPVLYWFKAKKAKDGMVTFMPNLIDDDSGIGTQFAIVDLDGDGLLDVIVSNKRGTFVFLQVRTKED